MMMAFTIYKAKNHLELKQDYLLSVKILKFSHVAEICIKNVNRSSVARVNRKEK